MGRDNETNIVLPLPRRIYFFCFIQSYVDLYCSNSECIPYKPVILSMPVKWSPLQHFPEQITTIIVIIQIGSLITKKLSALRMSGVICKMLSISPGHAEGIMN